MPFHYRQYTLFLLLSSVTLGLSAASIGTVTLDNGATVLLHDDHTWEYIAINTKALNETNKTIPSKMTDSNVVTPSNADQASLLRSGLLNTAVKYGVKVTYSDSVWQDQALGLKFTLSSNNADGVVIVKVAVSFYDDNGNKITEKNINVWQASYRLPDTYLRKGEPKNSRVVWIDGINKANWTNKLLSLKVVEVETR
ncbi:DUF3157 family protein [uncultured Psychromonas sp.]|uniref:DUF3157 family protein n=1 Tax=uncultured Psychromonas sp. TaxID=173974 RepID=UPI0026194001|nr:DUF3157 family protein [uncultured Psychromonas sp.]